MLKVVIIDNSAISRGLLNTVLTNGGYEVVGDGNTTPASLAKLIKLQPQVVCADVGDTAEGMSVLDTLRTGLPRAILFVVSGKIEAAVVEQALQRGAHGFIVKPFNSATVLKTIRNSIIKVVKQQQAKAVTQTTGDTDVESKEE
jgi:two-component system chemotaxis response regulator CheY